MGKYAAPAPFPEEMRVTPNHKLSVSPPLRLSAMHKWCVGHCHGAQAGTIVSPCIFYQLGQLADWAGALRGLRGPIKWVQPAKPGQGVSRAGPWILLLIPTGKLWYPYHENTLPCQMCVYKILFIMSKPVANLFCAMLWIKEWSIHSSSNTENGSLLEPRTSQLLFSMSPHWATPITWPKS